MGNKLTKGYAQGGLAIWRGNEYILNFLFALIRKDYLPKKNQKRITQMIKKDLSQLTNEELLQEAKKMKTTSIVNAILIGFLIGIIFYSIMENSVGFFTLIPLFFAYKLINNSKYNSKELDALLKERNLK